MVASQNNFGNERNEKSLIINHGIVPKILARVTTFIMKKVLQKYTFSFSVEQVCLNVIIVTSKRFFFENCC